MHIRIVLAALVLCACGSTPKGTSGASPGGKAGAGCKRVEADAKKLIAKEAPGRDVELMFAAVAPFGRCVDPKGGWALTLDAITVDPVEYYDPDDTADEPTPLEAWSVTGGGSPAYVTPEQRVVVGRLETMPATDEVIDASGTSVSPNYPYSPAIIELRTDRDWTGDGVPDLVAVGDDVVGVATLRDGNVVDLLPAEPPLQVTGVDDFDGDGRLDLVDKHSFRVHLNGDGRYAHGLTLVAHGQADGTFSTDDAATRAHYAKACAGLGRSPWVRDNDTELTLVNLGCAAVHGVPLATITAALDAELAALGDTDSEIVVDGDAIKGGLGDAPSIRVGRDDGRVVHPIAGATAVSFEPAFKGYTFDAPQAIDGDLGTSWQPKKGKGPWLTLRLAAPVEVSALELGNGFQRSDALGDLFLMNRRPTKVQIVIGKTTHEATLDPSKRDWQLVTLPAPVTAGEVKLVILDSAAGSKWQNVALSEVRVLGPAR